MSATLTVWSIALSDKTRHDHTLLIFLVALFVFNSPLSNWWARIGLPWYAIFVVWAVVILLTLLNIRRNSDDGY